MNKEQFVDYIETSKNWTRDSYGNYKSPHNILRLKLQSLSVRFELIGPEKNWIKRNSDYFKNVTYHEDGNGLIKFLKIKSSIIYIEGGKSLHNKIKEGLIG